MTITKLFYIEVYQSSKGVWEWEMHSALTGTHHGFALFRSYDKARRFAIAYCEICYQFFVRRPLKNPDMNDKCSVRKIKGISKRGVTVTIMKEKK